MRHLLEKLPASVPGDLVLDERGNFKPIEKIFDEMQTFFDEETAGKGSWRLRCGRCGRMIETADDWGGMDGAGKTICVDCLHDDLINVFDLFATGGLKNETDLEVDS